MTGIQEPADIAGYVRRVWGDENSCMAPEDRAAALIGAVNEQLSAVGVPMVGWDFKAAAGNQAQFHKATWEIWLEAAAFAMEVADTADTAAQAGLVDTVYHEARHAEQWFRMARERIGLGATVEQATEHGDIPEWVVQWAALAPITQCDYSQYEAEQWYQSVYGSGSAHREHVLTDPDAPYEDYRNLPEEADAWRTGDAVNEAYRRHQP